jgi:mannonate dehydratase
VHMTFRWFGTDDQVTLPAIRQIPGIEGIVTSLFDLPVGHAWPRPRVDALCDEVGRHGFRISVIESIPVHEDIKLGKPERDRWIDQYCQSLAAVGAAGIPVVCYNFMPVFDWMRTDLHMRMADDAETVAYDHEALERIDLSRGLPALTAWVTSYDGDTLAPLLAAYRAMPREQLWDHFAYFIERIAPAAEEAGVKLGLHPDDPPWDLFGVPRIMTDGPALQRVISLSTSKANGITFCTGSLGVLPANDLPSMIRALGSRVHFMHCRNVRTTGDRSFYETAHPSRFGDVAMVEVMEALRDIGFTGPMRPDHGRMIWGETGRPASGLYDRALGAMYLQGLWEGVASGGTHS